MGQVQLNKSLRSQQDQILKLDVQDVLTCYRQINIQTNRNYDHTRVLGVVAANSGAEKYLPRTIPKIIDQIDELGLKADIVLGLNNGYACETVIQGFTTRPDVQVVHLYTEVKVANNQPARIFAQSDCQGNPYHLQNAPTNHPEPLPHRIFILHQKASPHAAGKIRVLGDIYGSLFLSSIAEGWQPPALLITFDAESEFLSAPGGGQPIVNSNGLKDILQQLISHPSLDILGATSRHSIYRSESTSTTPLGTTVSLPDFSQEVSSISWFLNIVYSHYHGYHLRPAGGTVGKTDVMISLFVILASRYPGARIDDIHMTIIAHHANFRHDSCLDVIQTNRVPRKTDLSRGGPLRLAWQEQMVRWLAGIQALKDNYGEHNVSYLASSEFPWWIVLNPIQFIQSWSSKEKINLFVLLKAFRNIVAATYSIHILRQIASHHPDTLAGTEAYASWEMAAHVTPELVLEPSLNQKT